MAHVVKKKEEKPGLIDFVFSWSLNNVMNKHLFRDKVKRVPETFSSREHYFQSFIYPLLEETRADLQSEIANVFHAPVCEVYKVKGVVKDSNDLRYKLWLKPGAYKPEFGDLIALTEVKPRRIGDLDRPNRPYHIALVQATNDQKIPVLSSKAIRYDPQDEWDRLFVVYLTNLTTNLRIWKALHPDVDGGNMKIINSVLKTNPHVDENCISCFSNKAECSNVSKSRKVIAPLTLDNSQNAAVISSIATTECRHKNSVKLIWGPPGTGKTKTVAALVFALFQIKRRALTCAPTNVAVLGVTKRLMSLLGRTLMYENYGLGDVLLFGNGERMKIDDHEDLHDVFLKHRVCVLCHCFAPLTGWNGILESMICLLEDPQGQYLQYLRRVEDENGEDSDKDADDTDNLEEGNEKENENPKNKNQTETLERKFWKNLIIRDLNEAKKKNSKDKKPSDGKSQTKSRESRKNDSPLTFKEFLAKTFRNIGQQLMICITGLCTHMPTKCLPLEVVKCMIKVHEMLKALLSLLNEFDVSREGLKEALQGNGDAGSGEHGTNLRMMRLQLLEILRLLRGTFSVPNFYDEYHVSIFCQKNACLLFCTASSSAKLLTEGMTAIELVIIDEAAQLKECESSIPLQLPGLRHAVLVGDEKQLPAMVQSQMCEKADFGRSLFERLVILGHEKHLLDVQYRMHPSISLFPNTVFYNGEIKNGRNVNLRCYSRSFLKGEIFGSFSFIDVNNGKEEFDERCSLRNMVEVSVVAEIISKLYQESTLSKQKLRVGCISPYKAQVAAIQKKLGNTYYTDANEKFSVNVRSVDGFQGGEEDVIIISTVRCNGKGSIGFLSNCQRVNVSLTRARHCLWVLGNAATLTNSGSVWQKLVLDAKNRNCFHNANEDEGLARAINTALVELGDLTSLFSTDSVLFTTSKWKVHFSAQFHESMTKLHDSGILENVIRVLVNLANGWREQVKDKCLVNLDGASSQLMECYHVKEPLKLIWTIEISRENLTDTQVIKIWDILPKFEIPELAEALDVLLGSYTWNLISRCLCKRIEGNLTLPMTWPVAENARSFNNSGRDSTQELALKLTATSLSDAPRSSARRTYRGGRGRGW